MPIRVYMGTVPNLANFGGYMHRVRVGNAFQIDRVCT
jgi:hypothetical protein